MINNNINASASIFLRFPDWQKIYNKEVCQNTFILKIKDWKCKNVLRKVLFIMKKIFQDMFYKKPFPIFCLCLALVTFVIFLLATIHPESFHFGTSEVSLPFSIFMLLLGLEGIFLSQTTLAYLATAWLYSVIVFILELVGWMPYYLSLISSWKSILSIPIFSIAFIVVYLRKRRSRAVEAEEQIIAHRDATLAQYQALAQQQDDDQKILIHDIKNHLQSLEALLKQGEYEKTASYLESLTESDLLQPSASLSDRKNINAILTRYSKACKEKEIRFMADIRSGCLSSVAEKDITILLCNLLDNAVEACSNLTDAQIEIRGKRKENTSFTILTVRNTCPSSPFTSSAETLPASHKADRKYHGYGLKSVRRAVKKYDGEINLYYDENERVFQTVVLIRETP